MRSSNSNNRSTSLSILSSGKTYTPHLPRASCITSSPLVEKQALAHNTFHLLSKAKAALFTYAPSFSFFYPPNGPLQYLQIRNCPSLHPSTSGSVQVPSRTPLFSFVCSLLADRLRFCINASLMGESDSNPSLIASLPFSAISPHLSRA